MALVLKLAANTREFYKMEIVKSAAVTSDWHQTEEIVSKTTVQEMRSTQWMEDARNVQEPQELMSQGLHVFQSSVSMDNILMKELWNVPIVWITRDMVSSQLHS